ncbi:MAG: LuxR C-terminal-related transcriptional regulator, partial [Candidatus Nanopelagicales bacterium]|nr:LuxR C-terminal-related transcriptional regulator [Candidatus Nanopelagicales bacterium]
VETAPQEGGILLTIRELRQQGWHRLVMVSPRGDENTVRLALAAKVRSFVVARSPGAVSAIGASTTPPERLDLSDRERQVIQHVANGNGNREVAERLSLSPLTVKSHMSRIGRKLGTGDRAQIVALAMRAGLIH